MIVDKLSPLQLICIIIQLWNCWEKNSGDYYENSLSIVYHLSDFNKIYENIICNENVLQSRQMIENIEHHLIDWKQNSYRKNPELLTILDLSLDYLKKIKQTLKL